MICLNQRNEFIDQAYYLQGTAIDSMASLQLIFPNYFMFPNRTNNRIDLYTRQQPFQEFLLQLGVELSVNRTDRRRMEYSTCKAHHEPSNQEKFRNLGMLT